MEVRWCPSPTTGPRREGLTPHLIVLHYTAMVSAEAALDRLCEELATQGIAMGSHDDRSSDDRAVWRGRGVTIAEFPIPSSAKKTTYYNILHPPQNYPLHHKKIYIIFLTFKTYTSKKLKSKFVKVNNN